MTNIGFLQNYPVFGDKQVNFKQIESLARNRATDVLVLPELFATGYTFTSREEAQAMGENLTSETAIFLQNLARSLGGIVVGGFIEKDEGHIYNSAMMVSSEGVVGNYRKIHLFNKEKLWFSPGNRPFRVQTVNGMKIGIMICFDWFFPESARTLALHGAELIAHPSNLVLKYCQDAMVTRCFCNQVFAVTANRIGTEIRGEDDFTFTGHSQITSPTGSILAQGPIDQTAIEFVSVELAETRQKHITPLNHALSDRKPNFYF